MAVNQIKTRILNKISTWAEWESVKSTFKPLRGEICIVEIPTGTANAIDKANGSKLTPPAIGIKVGNGDDFFGDLPWIQAIAGDVTAWCKKNMADFDKFKAQVKTAAGYTGDSLDTALTNLQNAVDGLNNIVVNGDDSNAKLRAAITAVEGTVSGHTTKLGELTADKADKTQVATDITAAKTAVLGEDAASSDKTVAGAYSAASDAAAQALADANLYTDGKVTDILGKNDDNSNFVGTVKGAYAAADAAQGKADTNANEITTIKGQIEEINETLGGSDGKSVSARLEDLETKDTELTAAIGNNTNAIGEEVSRATGAEEALSARIAKAEAFLNEATIDPDNTDLVDTLKELQEYITADESGAAAMAASIADAKQKLLGEEDLAHYGAEGYSIKEIKIVADQAAADVITAQSTAESANDLAREAKELATTNLGEAKRYSDEKLATAKSELESSINAASQAANNAAQKADDNLAAANSYTDQEVGKVLGAAGDAATVNTVYGAHAAAKAADEKATAADNAADAADEKAVAAQGAINKLIASSVAEDAGKISTIAFENGELKATRKAITMDDMDASATFIFYCGTALELT